MLVAMPERVAGKVGSDDHAIRVEDLVTEKPLAEAEEPMDDTAEE